MASKQIVELTDDLDSTGKTPADETVSFALDGVSYEIDLSDRNAKELRTAMQPFIDAARVRPRNAGRSRSPKQRERSGTIRRWAKSAGLEVPDRGRIPSSITELWEAAGRPAA